MTTSGVIAVVASICSKSCFRNSPREFLMKKSITEVPLKGRRVIMRVDFNVPQDKETGEITNPARIVAALPTIKYILEQGGSAVLMSHLGRPDGKRVVKFSLKPVAKKLEELLGKPADLVRVPLADITDCHRSVTADRTRSLGSPGTGIRSAVPRCPNRRCGTGPAGP